ncbi:two-component regulator propeller domain-containing protein [Polaribacter sp. IC073]|uniref:ligand-binding sensor domain-containing protein n=1 Tax=Polaribacter sp. IC073 TaxID=2508540 RepID=UPI0011BD8B7D|nr:two-component regulator propeller domain-containing protein [Polaribacter sp. IC073]TXD46357.1 hypothetical protein ES045_14225 [Polaribacter sp. IC073]
MNKNKLFIILAIITLNFGLLQSQDYVLRFQNITTKQGLSDNRVTDVLQDSKGLLWAATELAINKYNGEKTKIYYINQDCIVNQLLEDDAGNIWASTSKGLYIYNQKKDAFNRLESSNKEFNNLLKGSVLNLIQTNNGYIWFTSYSVLVGFKLDSNNKIEEKTKKRLINKETSSYTSIAIGKKNMLWLANSKGEIYIYNEDKLKKSKLSNNLNKIAIKSMIIDKDNLLWVATNGDGLFRFNLDNNRKSHFLKQNSKDKNTINNNFVLDLFLDNNNNIWIGTDGGGLNLYEKKSGLFYSFQQSFNNSSSISDNSIISIHHGLDNTILVSTVHGGICIIKNDLDIKRISARNLGFNYMDGQSSIIIEDKNRNIWLSAGRDGLRKYNPKTKQLTSYIDNPKIQTDLSGNIILALMEDTKDRIWIGTLRGGLNIYDTKNKKFLDISGSKKLQRIYTIKKTKNGNIWVGSSQGIRVFDMNLNILKHIQVSSQYSSGNNITSIYEDIKGDMWVGSRNGLHKYEINGNNYKIQSYYSKQQDSTSLTSNYITSIAETDDLSLLVGTYGYGVNKYSRTTNTFKSLKTKNNIEGSIIRGILKDHNKNMWFSTNTGLSKMDEKGNIINLTTNEGVQAFNGGAATLTKDGAILMASSLGLTYFKPEDLKLSIPMPIVFFTSALIITKEEKEINHSYNFNEAIINTPLEIPNNTISFSINFSSSYFYDANILKYAYRLKGINDSWQSIKNRGNLSFSSLKPGNYILEIKVANELNLWSPHVASLNIKVLPTIWQRKSTRSITVVFFLTLIIIVFRWRTSTIKKQREKLKSLLNIKTDEVKKQQEEVFQSRIEILNAEKLNQKLNRKKLEGELNFKINELTNNTLLNVHKNNLLNDIKEKLKYEIKQSQINKERIRDIISHIDDSFILDKDWENFYSIFNQVHPTFIKELKNQCTKLSERDIQLSALIKLNFPSQHIATFFGISLSSVKVARHRLRKKLELNKNESLKDFLLELNTK